MGPMRGMGQYRLWRRGKVQAARESGKEKLPTGSSSSEGTLREQPLEAALVQVANAILGD